MTSEISGDLRSESGGTGVRAPRMQADLFGQAPGLTVEQLGDFFAREAIYAVTTEQWAPEVLIGGLPSNFTTLLASAKADTILQASGIELRRVAIKKRRPLLLKLVDQRYRQFVSEFVGWPAPTAAEGAR